MPYPPSEPERGRKREMRKRLSAALAALLL